MKQFRFRKFQVYKDAIIFRKFIKELIKKNFPKQQQFVLTSQLERALNSIILNVAEGSAKGTDKNFANFLDIALGSVHECVACFDIALTDEFITKDIHQRLLEQSAKISDQLSAFRRTLLKK